MSIVLYSIETSFFYVQIRQEKGGFTFVCIIQDKRTLQAEKRYFSSFKAAKKAIKRKVL